MSFVVVSGLHWQTAVTGGSHVAHHRRSRAHRHDGRADVGPPRRARAAVDRRACALDARVRIAPVARRLRVDRDHRRPDRHWWRRSAASLQDEFEIPGSDTQKATDLIESEFASEQGGVLNVVFAAPEGERLDTPERQAAIEGAIAELKTRRVRADRGRAPGSTSVGDPFSDDTFSDDGRIAYAEAQFDRVIYEEDREQVVAVQDAVREAVEPAGVTVEFNGDAEFPPLEQGTQELLGLLAALIVLLVVFRTFVATFDPDRARDRRGRDRVPAPLHPRRPDRHQHDHAAARVDDRPRRRHRLLALHRHALPAAPARGALAARRRRRGGRVRGPRRRSSPG